MAQVDSAALPNDQQSVPTRAQDGSTARIEAAPASESAFHKALAQRRKRLSEHTAPNWAEQFDYAAILNIPQGHVSVNALACSTHLFTGGSDGFIRKYDLSASITGLSPRSRTSSPPPSSGVLLNYWENSDQDPGCDPKERLARARFGPRPPTPTAGSAVHSLLIDREEMYLLAGSASGAINLFGVRLDEGHCRHVFPASGAGGGVGHKEGQAVSSLIFSRDDTSFISGGWDANVFVGAQQWDLNTGKRIRQFEHATSQITSLAFRPTEQAGPGPSQSDASKEDGKGDPSMVVDEDEDAEGSSTEGEGGIAESLGASAAGLPLPPRRPRIGLPKPTDPALPQLSRDVLLGSCVDGTVLLWDRRVAKGSVRAFCRPKGQQSPWATQSAWSCDGHEILVARRNEVVDVYDLRASQAHACLAMPSTSGPVTALLPLPKQRVIVGSGDDLRLVDYSHAGAALFKIIPGHLGGPVASILMNTQRTALVTALGHRGFTDAVQTNGVQVYGPLP